MTTREYVRTTDGASLAVAAILGMVNAGEVEPVISFDIETMTAAGLEKYPGTTFDDAGNKEKRSKKRYLEFAQHRWRTSFDPRELAKLGIYIPTRLTNGNERKGVTARAAWEEFRQAVLATDHTALEACRWTWDRLGDYAHDLIAAEQSAIDGAEALVGVKGKSKLLKVAEKERDAATLAREEFVSLGNDIAARIDAPLDLRLLVHIVLVPVEGRIKVDPVAPGLDPYTSDIFSLQFTLRRVADGELLTWVFNHAQVPVAVVAPLFQVKKALYLAHNAKFDLTLVMHKLGLKVAPKNVYCTAVGSRLLYLGLQMSHNLKDVAYRFAGYKMDKAVRDTFIGVRRDELTAEQIDYGAWDTEVLFAVRDAQLKVARERGQVELLETFGKLSWITAKWQLEGFRIDADKWMVIAAQVAERRDGLARQLEDILLPEGYREMLGGVAGRSEEEEEEGFDPESEDDVRPDAIIKMSQTAVVVERLQAVLGFEFAPIVGIGKNGLPLFNKHTRPLIEAAYKQRHRGDTHPFFKLFDDWAAANKQANTYGVSFLWNQHPITGHIHSSLNIAGTDTGRYSSSGPNLLNIPRGGDDVDFRAAFLAPEGFLFGNCDYSAMEQRIAADLTHDPALEALFNEDGDSHSVTAALMFHVDRAPGNEVRVFEAPPSAGGITKPVQRVSVPASWSASELMRFIVKDQRFEVEGKPCSLMDLISVKYKKVTRQPAKSVGLGFMFGMTKFGVARGMNIPVDDAAVLVEELFAGAYPGLVEGFERAGEQPFLNAIEGADGRRYGYAVAYCGLRRWFALPENPSRRYYDSDDEFYEAQKEFRKRCGSVRREAKNVGTQGGNAVIMAEALLRLVEIGEPLGVYPALGIYDEMLVLVPKRVKASLANALIEQAMLEPSEKYIKRVPSKAEANPLSEYWKKFD